MMIFLVLVELSTLVLIIGLSISFHHQRRQLEAQTQLMTEQNVKRSAEALSTMLQTMEDTSSLLVNQFNLNALDGTRMNELLSNSIHLNRDIVSIVLFDSSGQVVAHHPTTMKLKPGITLHTQQWYQSQQQYDQSLYSMPHVQNLFVRKYPWVISNTVPVYYDGEKHLLMIDFHYEMFERFFSGASIGKRGYTFIVDRSGNVVYHPFQQLVLTQLKEELVNLEQVQQTGSYIDHQEQAVIASQRIGITQWSVVGKTYLDEMIKSMVNNLIGSMAGVFLVLFVMIAIIAYVSADYIARPIRKLMLRMNQELEFKTEGEDQQIIPTYVEAEQLNQAYDNLLAKVDHLMEAVKDEQENLRKSERNVLEAQIQPHFLYNTLESILWMIESGDRQKASHMVRSLGKLLRITLSKGKEYITLQQEFEHVKSYLEIQMIRYAGQFEYEIDLPESLADVCVIKLILQPLVENAIYHGLARMIDPGKIRIKAYQEQECLILRVEDNGLGISQQKLEQIQEHLYQKREELGIGLKNVQERIQIYYGTAYGLSIESELDEGTTIILTLPIQKNKE